MGKPIKMRIDADETQLILNLPEFALIPPDVGIYDEPVRWYKANLLWAKLIEGFVGHLLNFHAWKEAENENYIGVQEIATWLEGVEAPTPEFPTEGDCFDFPLSASFIDYEPQDPYNEPDYIPPDYLMPPFLVNDELEYPEIMGYQATDVFVPFGAVTIDPIDLATFNLPRLIISVKGTGQIELDLLAVSFGGLCVIKVGEMPNIADIILDNLYDTGVQLFDLEMPSGVVPHAGNIIRSTEINVEAEPDETTLVYVVFAPKINDSIIPIAFGGGVRLIQLCNFEGGGEIVAGIEDIRFDLETCFLQKRVAGEWLNVDGWEDLEACIGGGMATKEDIKQALIEWTEDTASRYLGVELDEDGNPTFPDDGSGDGTVPPDDPETPLINENKASKMGGAIVISRALEKFFDKLDSLYGGTNGTPATTAADTKSIIKAYFPSDAAQMDGAIDLYYTYRTTNSVFNFNTSTTFENYMYCKGYNELAFNQYLIDLTAFSEAKRSTMSTLVTGLSEEFWDLYFAQGAAVPSTQYRGATCENIADEAFALNMAGANPVTYTTNGTWKLGHRLLIKISGTYTDTDNANLVGDGMYVHNTSTGVKTFNPVTYNFTGGVTAPVQSEVPFEASHVYEFTVEKVGASAAGIITKTDGTMVPPNRVGTLNFEIIDLGEYAP